MGRVTGTLAALAFALALVACGGGSPSEAREPALPGALASSLADEADAVASALESGDRCGAAQLADELRRDVDAAVSAGKVPAALRGELERSASELQNELNCEEEPKEKHGDEGKKKGHAKHDDTATLGTTTTTPTTTGAETTTAEGE